MAVTVAGQVGPQTLSDGSNNVVRQGRLGEMVTQDAHGRYYETVARQFAYVATTAVAGVAPGTVLSTTPPWILWNPPASGVLLALLRSQIGYLSGTLGAGFLAYAYVSSQPTIPTGGTELVPVCLNLSATRGRGRCFQASTLLSTPVILKPGINITQYVPGAPTANTTPPFSIAQDDIAAEIVVPPSTALVMQGVTAAGTTPLVIISGSWEEVPLASASS